MSLINGIVNLTSCLMCANEVKITGGKEKVTLKSCIRLETSMKENNCDAEKNWIKLHLAAWQIINVTPFQER